MSADKDNNVLRLQSQEGHRYSKKGKVRINGFWLMLRFGGRITKLHLAYGNSG
jgi:hypothetical protein